jgi:hypothetical protein
MNKQHQWLEDEIEKACRTAKKNGLTGDEYHINLFSSGGRIFDSTIDATGLKAHVKMDEQYPTLGGPTILRVVDGSGQAFEVGLVADEWRNGVLIKEPARQSATA